MASVMPGPGQIKTKQIAVLWFYRRKRIGVKLVYIWINLYKNNTKIFCCIRLVCCQIQTKYTLDTVYLRTYFQFHWLQNFMIQKPFKQEAKKKKKITVYKEKFSSPTAEAVSLNFISDKRKQSGCTLMEQLVTAVQL